MTRAIPLFRKHNIQLSAGIATGKVLSSIIREKSVPHYRIFGHAMNLAARIRGSASPGEILIDSETSEMVSGVFDLKPLGEKRYKNVDEPVRVFHVLDERRRDIRRRDFSNPFVGRAAELEALNDLWARFLKEEETAPGVSAVSVTGEAGIGKSRLVERFRREQGEEAGQLGVACTPYQSKLPWHLWREVLGRLLGGSDGMSLAEVKKAFAKFAHNLELSQSARASLEILLGLRKLGEGPGSTISPAQFQHILASDLSETLAAVAKDQPLLIALDDLQWADSSSLAVLTKVLLQHKPARVFFLLIYRSDFEAPKEWNQLTRFDLGLMPQEERKQLINLLMDARQFLPEVRDRITSQLDGTPYYLVEVIRSLRARLGKDAVQQLSLAEDMKNWVPRSLREMLQARLDALDVHRKTVLQCAAVIGQRFTLETLELYDHIQEDLVAKLLTLKSLEYIEDLPLPQELQFAFRHHTMREVTYQSLLESQRRELHRVIASRLERQKKQKDDLHHLLAYHYDKADENEKAIHHLVRAGIQASEAGALPEAVYDFESALKRIDRSAPGEIAREEKLTVLFHLGRLYRYKGEKEKALRANEQARVVAQKLRLGREGILIDIELALLLGQTGDYTRAKSAVTRAEKKARRLKDSSLIAHALNIRGLCAWNQSDWEEARKAFAQSNRFLSARTDPALSSDIKNNMALLDWKAGDLASAETLLKQAIPLRKKVGDRFKMAITTMNLGIVREQLGRMKNAERAYQDAISVAASIQFVQVLSAAHANLANLYLTREEYPNALKESALSLELAEGSGDRRSAAIACENLALSNLGLGHLEETRRWIDEGKEIARKLKDKERLFSLDLVKLEAALLSHEGNGVKGLLKRLGESLEKNGYVTETPRLLRMRALHAHNKGQNKEALAHAERALEEAQKHHNAPERTRLKRLKREWKKPRA